MSITEFLLARIAEDEAEANAIYHLPEVITYQAACDYERMPASWRNALIGDSSLAIVKQWASRPGRMRKRALAECAAKRAIVAVHPLTHDAMYGVCPPYCANCGEPAILGDERGWDDPAVVMYPCTTLRALAAVYADHPDYDPGWAL